MKAYRIPLSSLFAVSLGSYLCSLEGELFCRNADRLLYGDSNLFIFCGRVGRLNFCDFLFLESGSRLQGNDFYQGGLWNN